MTLNSLYKPILSILVIYAFCFCWSNKQSRIVECVELKVTNMLICATHIYYVDECLHECEPSNLLPQ